VVALGDVRGAAGGLGACRGGGGRHRGLLVSWAAPLAALHLMSGAGQRFSDMEHSFSSQIVG
jgi:hypothetical protein